MNTPNKLTVFRIALMPFIVFFLVFKNLEHNYLYAFLVFLVASYTDRLDGHIARKTGDITSFGKIMDPLADKILTSSIFICFASLGLVPVWAAILIVSREFIVTSVRFLILESKKRVISANIWGKLKTVSQMITISIIFLFQIYIEDVNKYFTNIYVLAIIQNLLIWVCVLSAVVSGIIYIVDNRRYIKTD